MIKLLCTYILLFIGLSSWAQDWIEIESGTSANIYGIDFMPNGTGWAVTYYPAQILKSTDGGLAWEVDTVLPGIFKTITCKDDNFAWVGGFDLDTEKPRLYRTINGGELWAQRSIGNTYSGQDISSILIFDDKGYVFGHDGLGKQCNNPTGGAPWQNVNFSMFDSPGDFYNADGVNGDTVLACASDHLYLGSSWDPEYFGTVYDVNMVNDTVAYLVTPTRVAKSVNAGRAWSSVSYHQLPTTAVINIVAVSESNLYLAGPDGLIYQSFDGGNTWGLDYDAGSDRPITELKLVNGNLWATGHQGLILVKQNVINSTFQHQSFQPVSMYPNPTGSMLHIQLPERKTNAIRTWIYDLTGRSVYEEPFNPDLDVSFLDVGQYIVVVEAKEGFFRSRLHKE